MIAFLLPLLLGAAATVRSAQEDPGRVVVVVPIHGELESTMLSLVRRGFQTAEAEGAAAIVFDIDTPGGDVELMMTLARAIGPPGAGTTRVPTVAFVNTRAWSAGALIALSCSRIFAAQGSSLGGAMPIQIGPGGIQAIDEKVRPKTQSILRAEFRAWAEAGKRNARLAEAMVDEQVGVKEVLVDGERRVLSDEEVDDEIARGREVTVLRTLCARGQILTLTAEEALKVDFVDGVVADRAELLRFLGVAGADVVELRATWAEGFVRFLRAVAPLFFIAGCVLAYVEMKIPGFGIPGLLAVVSFGLLLFGNYLAGLANWMDILLVLVGFGFLAVELFLMPGSLVFGILGALCVVGGLLLSFQNFLLPEFPSDWAIVRRNAGGFAMSLGAVAVLIYLVARFLPSVPLLRRLVLMPPASRTGTAAIVETAAAGLLGSAGTAVTDLRPAGKVEVAGRLLDAQTAGDFLARGCPVRVLEISGNRVVVERIP